MHARRRGQMWWLALALSACQAGTDPPGATVTLTSPSPPLGLGQNVFEVTVRGANDEPVSDADVHLLLVMPADPATRHPEMRTEGQLNHAGGGTYSGVAMVTMAGDWDVTVRAVRGGEELARHSARMTAVASRRDAPQ